MAQFIIEKLEEGKQARWLDICRGKFELSEWHAIAEEWYKAKQNRSSDESDAPCMLRKGLPRAFPGLEELKTESMKEGTQYRSRVFQCNEQLIQEVAHHLLPRYGGAKFQHYSRSNGQNQYVPVADEQRQLAASIGPQQGMQDILHSTTNQAALGGFLANGYNGVPDGSISPNYNYSNVEDFSLLDDSDDSWLNLEKLNQVATLEASPRDQQLSPYSVSSPYANSSLYMTSYSSGKASPYPPSTNGLFVPVAQSENGADWASPKNSVYGSPLVVSPARSYSPEPALATTMPTAVLMPASAPAFNPAMNQVFLPTVSQSFHLTVPQDFSVATSQSDFSAAVSEPDFTGNHGNYNVHRKHIHKPTGIVPVPIRHDWFLFGI